MRPQPTVRRLAFVLLAAAAALGAWVVLQPSRPPAHGAPAVGVAYRVELQCPEGFQLGDWLWRFQDVRQWPPRADPNTIVMPRDPASGAVTVTSLTQGHFLADSNHVQYPIVRDRRSDGRQFLCPGI